MKVIKGDEISYLEAYPGFRPNAPFRLVFEDDLLLFEKACRAADIWGEGNHGYFPSIRS